MPNTVKIQQAWKVMSDVLDSFLEDGDKSTLQERERAIKAFETIDEFLEGNLPDA